jgi:hypothetical protein
MHYSHHALQPQAYFVDQMGELLAATSSEFNNGVIFQRKIRLLTECLKLQETLKTENARYGLLLERHRKTILYNQQLQADLFVFQTENKKLIARCQKAEHILGQTLHQPLECKPKGYAVFLNAALCLKSALYKALAQLCKLFFTKKSWQAMQQYVHSHHEKYKAAKIAKEKQVRKQLWARSFMK